MKLWKIFKGLSGVSGAKYQRSANGLEQVSGRSIEYVKTKKNRGYTPNPRKNKKKIESWEQFFGVTLYVHTDIHVNLFLSLEGPKEVIYREFENFPFRSDSLGNSKK